MKKYLLGLLLFVYSFANAQTVVNNIGCEIYPADNSYVTITAWEKFNGYLNYAKYGDYLDALFSANDTYFELEFRILNYSLSTTERLIGKSSVTSNQRQFTTTKSGDDLNFVWYRLGTSTEIRGVTFADCLVDTNEHLIKYTYDGSIDTNNGLDRVRLYIDNVEVTAGKTLSSNGGTLGQIFNGTARLAFGQDVSTAGATGTSNWYSGEVKDIKIYSAGAVLEFHGIDIAPTTQYTGTYTRHAQPILIGTKDAAAQDVCQASYNAVVDRGDAYVLYYLASNPTINSDRDVTCMAVKDKGGSLDPDMSTGWTKRLSAGLPEIVYDVGAVGKFDETQVWLRNVLRKTDGTYEAWPMGLSSATIKIGYSTSTDGIAWTRENSGDPVYEDGVNGVTSYHVIYDEEDATYKMLYSGELLGEDIGLAEGGPTVWVKTHSKILFGENLGQVAAFKKIEGIYYIWVAKELLFFSGISEQIVLYRTADFTTFEYVGPQVVTSQASEFGVTNPVGIIKKPNGKYSMLFTSYQNHIGKAGNLGEEFTAVKVADLNKCGLPIAGRPQTTVYPSYVPRHWPLNQESATGTNFIEAVTGGNATINTTPVFSAITAYGNRTLGFVNLSGSQTITDTNNPGGLFNPATFGVKLRVELKTTGTHELFRIGNDVLVTLESGKLRVRLSSDGATYQKDYITSVNISKPTGMSYIDDHLYVGFTWIGGVLTLYNDFVPFTGAQVTETVDNALTNVNDSGADFQLGQNATIKIRSVSLMTGITDQQWIDLEI